MRLRNCPLSLIKCLIRLRRIHDCNRGLSVMLAMSCARQLLLSRGILDYCSAGARTIVLLDESLTAAAHEVDRMAIMINDMLDMIRVQGSFEGHQNDTTILESSIE